MNADSFSKISGVFRCIEKRAREYVILDEELLATHIRLLPDIVASGDLSMLDLLRVRTLDRKSYLLSEILAMSRETRIFYSLADIVTTAAEVLQARGDILWLFRETESDGMRNPVSAKEVRSERF